MIDMADYTIVTIISILLLEICVTKCLKLEYNINKFSAVDVY
jgi:hypothetical protein